MREKERKARDKELEALFNKRMREGFPAIVPKDGFFKEGDKFTVAGLRHMKDGTMIMNCKSGEETTMIAVVEKQTA